MRKNENKTADFLGVYAVSIIDMERDVFQAMADNIFSPIISHAFVGMVEDLCGNVEIRRLPGAVKRLLKTASNLDETVQAFVLEIKEDLAKSEIVAEFVALWANVEG
jgi:hypothetical protein